ncbi:MAG: alpha/beta hydrolase [Enhydrobacter sp.]|nr:MAG: alpha/beta hydrolase [Enhydrobacter sp.]
MPDPDPKAAPTGVPPDCVPTYRPADRYGFCERVGARLRYACWNAPGTARGSVVLLQGRAEFIEKYATEVVGELLARGLSVFAVDLRGQGLSDRPLPDHDKGHVDDFATYVADLDAFLSAVVTPMAPRPIVALSHSTSGNVVLRYLAERGSGPFGSAVFVSPMTALCRGGAIRALTTLLSPFGWRDGEYMVGTGSYDRQHRNFATNDVTRDERRYRFTDAWFDADRRLRLGGPTVGWLRQALRSIDRLATPGSLERIDLPVLLVSANGDRVVDATSHRSVASRIRGCELVVVDGAQHEILMETDPLRDRFWQAFDRFAQ